MIKTLFITLLAALGGYMLISTSGGTDSQIVIGANFSRSSFGAEWGDNNARGAELAVSEINAQGGVLGKALVLVQEDNQSESSAAATVAQKLVSVDHAQYMLTGWAHVTEPVVPIIDDAHVVTVTVSAGSRDITKKSPYLFRTWPQDHYAVQSLVADMQRAGYRRVGVLRTVGDWEDSLRDSFIDEAQRAGLTVVIDEGFTSGSDVRALSAKVYAADIDALFIPIAETDTARAVKQLRTIGVGSRLYFPVDFSVSSVLDSLTESEAEGVRYPVAQAPRANFRTAYVAKYGVEPGVSADTAYDAVYAIAHAIEEAGTLNPAMVKDRFVSFSGASGEVVFTEDGDRLAVPLTIMEIRNHKAVTLY